MNFKTTKISHHSRKKEPQAVKAAKGPKAPFDHKKYGIIATVAGLILLIAILITGIVKAIKSIDFTLFLKVAGDELLVDENNHTNFLILGKGGINHDGSDLTDTILLASLDQETNHVSMISIPRDLYISDKLVGSSKINEVYFYAKKYYDSSAQGLDHLKLKLEELTDKEIHYYFMVDFNGFKQMIDVIGGVDVYVEESIYDPYYPKDGTYLFEPFSIKKGQHHLDGEVALKYARSRKTTSDFDRARRQQQIIFAMKERALETDIILSTEKISEILNTLKSNIETNITVKEILTLGSIAPNFTEDSITHRLIHDDPAYCGGLLYTPVRELYGGMFVLLPAGGNEFLHKYLDLVFDYPYINSEETKIHILNGTKTAGVAGETKQILDRYCFDIMRFGNGNSQDITETTYYYKEVSNEEGDAIYTRPPALDYLQTIIPGKESTEIPTYYKEYSGPADLILEIGSDYSLSDDYMSDPFYYMTTIYNTTPVEDDIEST